MADQFPPQGQPDFEPPESQRHPPVEPFPGAAQPAQPFPPHGQPFPPPAQPGNHPQGFPPAPPGGYPPYAAPPPATGGRGSIWLGVGIAVAVLLVSLGLTSVVPYDSPLASVTNLLVVGLPFALVLGGIVMAAIPRTTRTGAGILIAIGSGILIAGGLCFALVLGLGAFGG